MGGKTPKLSQGKGRRIRGEGRRKKRRERSGSGFKHSPNEVCFINASTMIVRKIGECAIQEQGGRKEEGGKKGNFLLFCLLSSSV